jgi:small subunit ribosomal protein S17
VSERKPQGKGAKGASPAKPAAKAAAAKPVARAAAPAKEAPKPRKAPAAAAAPADPNATADAAGRKLSFKRTLIGRVRSDKMNKTIVVEVVRSKLDPVYKKYVRVRKTYQAHDEENTCRIGDRVEIIEHRPLSKMKRWKLLNLVERAVQE